MDSSTVTLHQKEKASMICVWAVEDNSNFRKAVVQEINDAEGMKCELALTSCEELLDRLPKASTQPNVILLDVNLPGMSGLEAISAIKAFNPDIQILILTMFDDRDTIYRALCSGASGYLLKASHEDLAESILQTASGGAPLSPPVARMVLNSFVEKQAPTTNYHLTSREQEVLQAMVDGQTKKQIADTLQLSYHTVDGHLRNIYRKLHVNNAQSAVSKALRERLC